MSKEHLTYFKVENFKRFDSLELTDIGQFNLIVGDNNVGKTSLLEALLISKDSLNTVSNLRSSLSWREIDLPPNVNKGVLTNAKPVFNYFNLLLKDKNKPLNAYFSTNIDQKNIIKLEIKQHEDNLIYSIGKKTFTHNLYEESTEDYLPLVAYLALIGTDLLKYYSNLVNQGRSALKEFISNMKLFIPNLEEATINKIGKEDAIFLGLGGRDEWFPLQTFGDGTKRLFRMTLEIIECRKRERRLMIDEIDTGIHHSRMKTFLKTIFQIAVKNEVQLFMTTHSLECQEAFAEVFEEPDMVQHQAKARQFSLVETPEGQVVANPFNFEQLQYALEIGFDTRGGKRGW